jgi:hypothetical protein
MRRMTAIFFGVIWIGLICIPSPSCAQDESKADSPKQPANTQPIEPYRLDFSFSEVADGKNVNTRHYSMDLNRGDANEVKIGTRVPVVSGTNNPSVPAATQFQYVDVGTNLWAQLREHGDELVLVVRSEVSNLDTSNDSDRAGANPPVIRQIKISGSTLLTTGKPILIGSLDDPNSKRQFQLEVLATKLK